ncbi:hypothetical protein E5S67_04493 [Microcoleus sp. IPMA8]|uniref:Uncharacterized protein n=1 Tax=Microcoleus asticus IPMA8 TaxID=2563858 RepID=A0ABX2D2L8_9CYAN|nr:hypothetical protein [Microcoleus asticus IPMA8]
MERINLLVSIISLFFAVLSFIFYLAARQIKADKKFHTWEITTIIDRKLERLQIIFSSLFQLIIYRNISPITNAKARLNILNQLLMTRIIPRRTH